MNTSSKQNPQYMEKGHSMDQSRKNTSSGSQNLQCFPMTCLIFFDNATTIKTQGLALRKKTGNHFWKYSGNQIKARESYLEDVA